MPYQPILLKGKTIKDAFRLTGHSAGIRAMVYWNSYIISGSDDKSIKVFVQYAFEQQIWDAKTGNCLKTLFGHTERILCLAVWNGYIVSGGVDTTIRVWNGTGILSLDMGYRVWKMQEDDPRYKMRGKMLVRNRRLPVHGRKGWKDPRAWSILV